MSMSRIFADFEARLQSERQREIEAGARDYRRSEYAKIQMLDRMAAQLGQPLKVNVMGAQVFQGTLREVGSGWVQLYSKTESVLIPHSSVLWWEGGSRTADINDSTVVRKLSFGYALRALCAARLPVRIFHTSDGASSEGTIERVGLDFVELSSHGIEGNYRAHEVFGHRVVPIAHIGAVSSLSMG